MKNKFSLPVIPFHVYTQKWNLQKVTIFFWAAKTFCTESLNFSYHDFCNCLCCEDKRRWKTRYFRIGLRSYFRLFYYFGLFRLVYFITYFWDLFSTLSEITLTIMGEYSHSIVLCSVGSDWYKKDSVLDFFWLGCLIGCHETWKMFQNLLTLKSRAFLEQLTQSKFTGSIKKECTSSTTSTN